MCKDYPGILCSAAPEGEVTFKQDQSNSVAELKVITGKATIAMLSRVP